MDSKTALVNKLQQDILKWEGYKPPVAGKHTLLGLDLIEAVFPNGIFPMGAVHELVCDNNEQAAASGGFITGILSVLMQQGGTCIWISRTRRLFAPALSVFGVAPHKVIFISLHKDKDALWVMEEALKCKGLAAVVCELKEMDFRQSRRFQLAVEHSHVTGFVLRNTADKLGSTACAARWQISSLPSTEMNGLPGIGFLQLQVELLKVRNGQTGKWVVELQDGRFVPVQEISTTQERQVG